MRRDLRRLEIGGVPLDVMRWQPFRDSTRMRFTFSKETLRVGKPISCKGKLDRRRSSINGIISGSFMSMYDSNIHETVLIVSTTKSPKGHSDDLDFVCGVTLKGLLKTK